MEYGDNLISRKSAINAVNAVPINGWVKEYLIQALETAPSAQPEPEWKTDHGYMWLCPKCGLPVHSDFEKCVRCGHER